MHFGMIPIGGCRRKHHRKLLKKGVGGKQEEMGHRLTDTSGFARSRVPWVWGAKPDELVDG